MSDPKSVIGLTFCGFLLIEHLLKKFEIKTYFGIIGFVIASIVSIVKPLIGITISPLQTITGIILFIIGAIIAYRLGEE